MSKFKFIDLFAGIGGFHLAMHAIGGECVFASETDPHARKTYEHNFKKSSPELFKKGMFNEDIRKISPNELPDFDILCAGFPCQPFSQAGYKRGFDDNHKSERGNLFFNIVDILKYKKPKAFFLENVRGIINHDNGNTFKIIKDIIEHELGYSFYYKVIHASDYGLPQLRPRVFMIGFLEPSDFEFKFPDPTPLKFNMSDVWKGDCSREIGFTIRVGGRSSSIEDRRNWDSYLVNGEVKKLMPEQARQMQGFPDYFEFPVPASQAMKQLGNSVAVDAVKVCAQSIIDHLDTLSNRKDNKAIQTKNKGEWTELYTFFKLITDRKLKLANSDLNIDENLGHFSVSKISTLNIHESCYLTDNDVVVIKNATTGKQNKIDTSDFLHEDILNKLAQKIREGTGAFNIPEFMAIQDKLGISIIKGGNSHQKADILLAIESRDFRKNDEGFGIKSYLGNKPTLMNASGNTNFIFEVVGLERNKIDEINSIDTKNKLKDRISNIYKQGGKLVFNKVEAETMGYNLKMVDSVIPPLLSEMLLEFFVNRTSGISQNLENIYHSGKTFDFDLLSLKVKIKRLLIAILLGFFAGKKWDGTYLSNGIIVVKESGDQVGFHITHLNVLEDYLFQHIKFDTPSTTRHRYGSLILENDNKIYFKLNLQLRF